MFIFNKFIYSAFYLLISFFICGTSIAIDNYHYKEIDANILNNKQDGENFELHSVPLGNSGKQVDLYLEKFSIFNKNSTIEIKDKSNTLKIKPTTNTYLRGYIKDQPDSKVFFSIDQAGSIKNIIHDNDKIYIGEIINNRASSRSTSLEVLPKKNSKPFQCSVGKTHSIENIKHQIKRGSANISSSTKRNELTTIQYDANLIIETDYEYYALFNNTTAATNYIFNLIAYITTVYKSEINVNLKISALKLYTTSSDPWAATTSTSAALDELRSTYLQSTAQRTAVHLISGKKLGGGIAYVNSLCVNKVNTGSNYAYDTGVSASITGGFSPENPQIVWDSVVIAHELGHNFGSKHTHDYDSYSEYTSPIDCCYSDNTNGVCAAYTKGTQLPGIGTLIGGISNNGTGTIMSYCHLVNGGYKNLSMTFGKNHMYGIEANRVPLKIRNAIEQTVVKYPQCMPISNILTPINDNNEFVKQQYRDFLAREGDSEGITSWTNAINNSVLTRPQVQKGFIDSVEFSGLYAPLVRLYFGYFGRTPDYQGLVGWATALKNGMSLSQIATAFANSAEFTQRYGNIDNVNFVTLLYRNILNREPDPNGLNGWVATLNSGTSRGQVTLGFTESAENILKNYNSVFVVMAYVGNLRRAPEASGYQGWLDYLNTGASPYDLINGFINSTEWRNRFK